MTTKPRTKPAAVKQSARTDKADLITAHDFPKGRPAWPCYACGADAWTERPARVGGGWFCAVCHPAAARPAKPAQVGY